MKYPRGSEWRRWDLHVHTKGTNKNDQFTSADFNVYCQTLFKKALEKNIYAIGITDYFCVKNYRQVREYVNSIDANRSFSDEEKRKIKGILLLPNVELRFLPVTDSGRFINIHCIFNPEYLDSLDNDFFSSIEYCTGASRKFKMNQAGIIELGKHLDPSLSNSSELYKKGLDNFVVSHESLQKLYDENIDFRENTIICVSNSSNDGASALQKHYDLFEGNEPGSLDGVRKAIYCLSQMILSGNPEDRAYFLGKKIDAPDVVVQKCGSLKPCIHGSDAHTEDKLFTPDENRYCWIKADLTFEGLKQVIYEPEDRVCIQELIPEEKQIYQLIDFGSFNDNNFMPEDIFFNQNLTTIIGGKSTGKSILLRNIAQAIDPDEVRKRLSDVNLSDYKIQVDDFKVAWKDSQQGQKKGSEFNKKIIYIPQSYLNRLVDKEGEINAIDKIIENVLKQEKGIVYENLLVFEKENNQKIANAIASLFNLIAEADEQKEKIKNTGDKKGIKTEIDKLEKEISELKKTAGLKDKEIKQYDEFVEQIKERTGAVEVIESDKTELEKLKQQSLFDDPYFEGLSDKLKTDIVSSYEKLKKEYKEKWNSEIDKRILNQEAKVKQAKEELEKRQSDFKPLLEKANKVNALNEKIKQIEIQQNKLKQIEAEEKVAKSIQERQEKTITDLCVMHAAFYEKYNEAKDEILSQNIISGELSFGLNVAHRTQLFQKDCLNEVFDMRQLPPYLSSYKFSTVEKFNEDIKTIINNVIKDRLVRKKGYSNKEALTKILQNWFIFEYQIKQGGDELSSMSPGKKSFVLLKLLIELDSSKCPILLDQPEDDLDNRSIYYDLVNFIKMKKKERQIIVATHNPNLVIGADSECVIVANQNGDKAKNKEYKFEYVQGALENTFTGSDDAVLYKQGIQEHVCDILEGGKEAFEKREQKYGFQL
jgi:hypothetical protein